MSKPLPGTKIAILVANGFDQQDFTEVQKMLNGAGAKIKIISPDQGLVNGWEGQGWGHHFPVDQTLSTALGADFDMLVIPGGTRSMEKLKTTAHTKRFFNSFMNAGKPVAVFGDVADLLVFSGQSSDVAAHTNLYVAGAESEDRAATVAAMMEFFASIADDVKQAA